jgi:tetrahydromethanopterin S-methyltransferase subunit A
MTSSAAPWLVIAGSYDVGDPQGSVAVCTLTTESLIAPLARLPGVAIAGKVYTANLGVTRIVINVMANSAIRFLLVCGKDSPLFHSGQSLVALAERGVDAGPSARRTVPPPSRSRRLGRGKRISRRSRRGLAPW